MIPMVLSRRFALLGLSLSVLTAATPLRAADAKSVRAAIEALDKKYDEAFNKGDAGALASLHLDDAQILAPDAETVKGRPAIEQFWKAEIKSATTLGAKNASKPIEIEEHGGVAHETGSWVSIKAGGSIIEEGKYLVLWKKHDGQWKIFRETWNVKRAATK